MKIYVKVIDDKNQTFEGIAELKKITKKKTDTKLKIVLDSPAGIIQQLYSQNFFEINRTVGDVENKIKLKKYNFNYNAIRMALSRSKYLKHKGVRGSYSYIQKIPPN